MAIIFDPVTHAAQFLDVKGEPTRERQHLSLTYNKLHAEARPLELRPGPLRLALENRSDKRTLPTIWITSSTFDELLARRKPVLTAKRPLTNQTFRDLYRTDTLAIDQRLKILSLTFCSPTSKARPSSMNASAISLPSISSKSISVS